MHSRQAAEARSLSRRIFASLPWGWRVAHLLEKLAAETHELFGKYAYGEFLKAGVTDMPDINGRPAEEALPLLKGSRGADRLPRGYGKQFGIKLWRIALAKLKNPEIVDEAFGKIMVRMAEGKLRVREGASLKEAEQFVITSLLNAGRDLHRGQNIKQKREVPRSVGEDGSEIDITDPRAFNHLEDVLSVRDLNRLLPEIERRLGERAVVWLKGKLDGEKDKDIAEQLNLTPVALNAWKTRHLPTLQKIVTEYMTTAA